MTFTIKNYTLLSAPSPSANMSNSWSEINTRILPAKHQTPVKNKEHQPSDAHLCCSLTRKKTKTWDFAFIVVKYGQLMSWPTHGSRVYPSPTSKREHAYIELRQKLTSLVNGQPPRYYSWKPPIIYKTPPANKLPPHRDLVWPWELQIQSVHNLHLC